MPWPQKLKKAILWSGMKETGQCPPQTFRSRQTLDVSRGFREPAEVPFLKLIFQEMQSRENRTRGRTIAAEQKYAATVEALLANLAAAHMNVIDPFQFVAVSFNKNDYKGGELSVAALSACRDYLASTGLIDVAPGFQRWDADGVGKFGRRTRLRATGKMRAEIDASGMHRQSLSRSSKAIVQIRAPERKGMSIPADVDDSRSLLIAINARLAEADISLDRVMMPILSSQRVEYEGEDEDALRRKRTYAGDMTATTLYRVFRYNWRSGGRIYGGWWMSLPRAARPYLTINGSPTVELDFKALHPLLLYARTDAQMPKDPYVIDTPCSEQRRQMGKRTFNRLLNRSEGHPAKRLKIKASSGDYDILGKEPFSQYLASFTQRLAAIQQWFGSGEGIKLQYEDSLLALRVLQAMERLGIPTLPIHDSFIVAEAHERELRAAMVQSFHPYGLVPEIMRRESRVSRV
jgi:hypothetical protein